ncbi:MAG TPA: acetylornithine/succinylornithine family transaminase [Solirubrobacterales bacterium]|nr:acetylornithine/succinylornithine family transaminase [Solirubrobacterales bacterium]
MNLEELQALEQRYLMQTYRRAPVEFVRGEGAWLYDGEGRRYLDFLAGISVCSVGHCHPAVTAAVTEQAARLVHASNLFYTEPMVRLAERLVNGSLGGRAFLANSGTEANECAIKIARKHAFKRGVREPEIVSFEGDFHGRTYGALAATPKLARAAELGPMLPGFRSVPFDDAGALDAAVGPQTAAVLIEPIQGEAGVYPLSDETLVAARAACDRAGALLILDEVQTGLGRTGSLWAYEQTPVRPDLLTTGKALGGGLAVAACIADPKAGEVLEPGDHGSTFAGGPLAAGAALAVLDLLDDPTLLRRVRDLGDRFRRGLAGTPGVRDIRGRGLMLGIALEQGLDSTELCARLLQAGLIVNAPEPSTVRLLPPLTIGEAEVDRALELFAAALR